MADSIQGPNGWAFIQKTFGINTRIDLDRLFVLLSLLSDRLVNCCRATTPRGTANAHSGGRSRPVTATTLLCSKSPGAETRALFVSQRGFAMRERGASRERHQAALLNALFMPLLMGSAVSVATFCASAASSLLCSVSASSCLRA